MTAQIFNDCKNKEYHNSGNHALLNLRNPNSTFILDVGCGSGDNARQIKRNNPNVIIHGITLSEKEKTSCLEVMDDCFIINIEAELPSYITNQKYDTIIFSHVLEHLRSPDEVLRTFLPLLKEGGEFLIAVPNILVWNQRIKFLLGKFEYTNTGIMDFTHLKFFTYNTADKYLILPLGSNIKYTKKVEGTIPLWFFRKYLLPKKVSKFIDNYSSKIFPNLFGHQILIKVTKL